MSLRITSQSHLPAQLNWSQFPMAAAMQDELNRSLLSNTVNIYGEYALSIGDLSSEIRLPEAIYRSHYCYGTSAVTSDIVGDFTELPFQSNSIDIIQLPLTLEYVASPHVLLREINRCITADGWIVITGFNPLSMASGARFLPFANNQHLKQARFIALHRLHDWLRLLDFDVCCVDRYLVSDLVWQQKSWFTERVGLWCQQYLSSIGTMYTVVARKRSYRYVTQGQRLRPSQNLGSIVGRISQ